MQIHTSRFGIVEITPEDLITFNEGLLGFNSLRKFVLLDDPNDDIFAWLQSCEEPGIAFPVLEPELFVDNYSYDMSKSDLIALSLSSKEGTRAFSIITIPDDPTKMTANLKAPIIINIKTRMGRQCVLQDNGLAICEPIFNQLQQRVVQNPQSPIKHLDQDLGVSIKPSEAVKGPELSK